MKKALALFLCAFCLFLAAGCTQTDSNSEDMAGYIVIIDNTLYFDIVEILTPDDTDRITELQLGAGDMPNGFHIYNESIEKSTYELTDKTVYSFIDVNRLFSNADGDTPAYETTVLDEFLLHLDTTYTDNPPAQTVPFFVTVKGGKVVSVTEEFKYTI